MKSLKKKKKEISYYNIETLIDQFPLAKYYVVYGERSSGKTTSSLIHAIKEYVEYGKQFAYVRRWDEDIRGNRASDVFNKISQIIDIQKLTGGKYNEIYYFNRRYYFSKFDKEKLTRVNSPDPIGFVFTLSSMEHDKSTSYPGIGNIVFDEFLTRNTYMVDEFVIFCNVLSTIIRDRDDVKIFMLGNTVNMYCPYFREMGISKIVKKSGKGSVNIVKFGDSEDALQVAVEYTGDDGRGGGKPSDIYFAFDNPKIKMITSGSWELDIYPHCPMKIYPKNIKFTYIINFDDEMLQADIVKQNGCLFTYIHKKTTPIKDESKDLVFSQIVDPRKNWRRLINKPTDKISDLIWKQFLHEKVFYQDNFIGDTVANYIKWCNQQRL